MSRQKKQRLISTVIVGFCKMLLRYHAMQRAGAGDRLAVVAPRTVPASPITAGPPAETVIAGSAWRPSHYAGGCPGRPRRALCGAHDHPAVGAHDASLPGTPPAARWAPACDRGPERPSARQQFGRRRLGLLGLLAGRSRCAPVGAQRPMQAPGRVANRWPAPVPAARPIQSCRFRPASRPRRRGRRLRDPTSPVPQVENELEGQKCEPVLGSG
jgi:hypothetical protein